MPQQLAALLQKPPAVLPQLPAALRCSTALQATGDAGALAVQQMPLWLHHLCSCSRLPCLEHTSSQCGIELLSKDGLTDAPAAGSNVLKDTLLVL